MHGRSIESQWEVERKSAANPLEVMELEDRIGRWNTLDASLFKCHSVLDWRHLRRTSVKEAVHSPRLVRFGTFEVDLQAAELRKGGLKLKLTGQPFQVLAIMLERPGEVVTREELQKRLSPDPFDALQHNLDTALNSIREALGDAPGLLGMGGTLPR